LRDSSAVVPGDTFPFPVSDRDKKTGIEGIPDQFMDFFRVISLIHDIEVRMSDPVTLFQEFFSVRDIMDRVLRNLKTGNNLSIRINRDRGFRNHFLVLPVLQE
jgi:hypothetical protein